MYQFITIVRCNPSGIDENKCGWYSCIGENALSFQALSSSVNLELRYGNKVDTSSSCQYKRCDNEPTRFGQAVARVKLGKITKK